MVVPLLSENDQSPTIYSANLALTVPENTFTFNVSACDFAPDCETKLIIIALKIPNTKTDTITSIRVKALVFLNEVFILIIFNILYSFPCFKRKK